MQTQQVHGVTGSLLYSVKNASGKTSGNNFDELLQMQNTQATGQNDIQPANQTKDSSAEHVGQVEKEATPKETVESSETKETVTTEKEPVSEQKTETTEHAEESTEVDLEAAEKVSNLLLTFAEVVQDKLDITEEELEQFMEQLGITLSDLMNPEQLQKLVLFVNNEQDAVSLITDAELLSTVQELTAKAEELLKDAGLTEEELLQYIERPEFDAMLEEAAEQLQDTAVTEHEPDMQETEAVEVQTEVKSTTVEFQKEVNTDLQQEAGQKDSRNQDVTSDNETYATQFTQNLFKAAESMSEVSGEKDIVQMIREIADQILEKVKVTVTAETTSLEIVLTPDELGKVNLNVTEQDGVLKARFVTENELAKEAIESNLVQFKEMLNEQGLKVDSIEVAVGNFEFDKNGQAGESNAQEDKRNGRHAFRDDDSIGQAEETDQLARHFMEGGESTVNYMA